MMRKKPLDTAFHEWIDLVFGHPTPDQDEDAPSPWYWHDDWSSYWDAWWESVEARALQLSFATTLVKDSRRLIGRFDSAQINQGIWLLLSGPPGFGLVSLLWDEESPVEARRHCVSAMVHPFKTGVFTEHPDLDSCHMWWDLLRGASEFQHSQLTQAYYDAMSQVLQLPYLQAQMSALHELGHLHHPQKRRLIESFLSNHPELGHDEVEYAHAAIEGRLL